MLIIWISLDGLGDLYFDFDKLATHLQISADTASTRVGFSTLALAAFALRANYSQFLSLKNKTN
jgi:hypothetical protein